MANSSGDLYAFGPCRLDVDQRVLTRQNQRIPLPPKTFELLLLLVRSPGRAFSKQELMTALWPDTFVEEANLSFQVSTLRKALGDGASEWIETIPKHGYRFAAEVSASSPPAPWPADASAASAAARVRIAELREEGSTSGAVDVPVGAVSDVQHATMVERHRRAVAVALAAFIIVSIAIGWRFFLSPQTSHTRSLPRSLVRLTFDGGLQSEPTWSPDGGMIAYCSDRGGNFDIWVQQTMSTPRPVTSHPAHDWQPDWSPDGSRIVFRSERNGGGLYVVPALGGAETQIASFGYRPRWSRDGSQILFASSALQNVGDAPRLYVVGVDRSPPFEVQREFLAGMKYGGMGGYAWHPNGMRISVWGEHKERGRGFWTMPLVGGTVTTSEIDPEVKLQVLGAVTLQRFAWAPSGRYLYFEGVSQGVRNLWRVTVEPQTLRWVAGPDRLTVGAGEDTDIAISADGKKIALATRLERTRVWSLPFDPISGQLKGEARPETRAGIDAWSFDVTRDGKQLVFITRRADKTELNVSPDIPKSEVWKQSLTDGREKLLVPADEYFRLSPSLSPDGTRLTYLRLRASGQQGTTILVALDGGEETPLIGGLGPSDWSADGQWLLGDCRSSAQGRFEICLAPLSVAPHVERATVVATHPDLNLFIARFSPDQRWIVIQGVKYAGVSTIYAMPAAGGAIAQITEGTHWDDKPCWGPDGRTIYFVSDRGGFLNVWGIRFNPANGTRVGEPFRVTTFESPRQMVFPRLAPLQLRVTADRLFLNITELSGNIWILDNLDR